MGSAHDLSIRGLKPPAIDMFMGQEYNEDVTLGEVIFYRLKEDGQVVEEPQANMILDPADVPARFVSTVIGTFDGLGE